jgi:hypothetical protein
MRICPVEVQFFPWGRTNKDKTIVAIRSYAKAPKRDEWKILLWIMSKIRYGGTEFLYASHPILESMQFAWPWVIEWTEWTPRAPVTIPS